MNIKKPGSGHSIERVAAPMVEEASESKIRKGLFVGLFTVGPILLLLIVFASQFTALINSDAMDFAQIGRNLGSGRGFSTSILRPLALGDGPVTGTIPETSHGPLYPLLLALAFGVFGARDAVAAALSGLFYVLTVWAVYALGKRVFGGHIAAMAALLIAVNVLMLEYATSGLHITLCIFLATCLFLTAFKLAKQAGDKSGDSTSSLNKGPFIQLGILSGLLYLAEPLMVWAIPLVVGGVGMLGRGQRWRNVITVLIPLCILVLPWMSRNAALTGNPVFGLRGSEIWMHTAYYPDTSGYRLSPSEVTGSNGLLRAIVKKVIFGVGQVLQILPQFTGSWVLAFFLPALLVRFSEPAANTLRRIVVASFLAMMLLLPIFGVQPIGMMPLFAVLVPPVLVFALAYIVYLVQQANVERSGRVLLTSCLAVVVAYPLLTGLVFGTAKPSLRGIAVVNALKRSSGPNEACLSDQPWLVAWHSDRRAVWAPASSDAMRRVRQNVKALRWIVATPAIGDIAEDWKWFHQALSEYNRLWYQAYVSKRPEPLPPTIDDKQIPSEKFPLLHALSGFAAVRPIQGQEGDTVVAVLPGLNQKVGSR